MFRRLVLTLHLRRALTNFRPGRPPFYRKLRKWACSMNNFNKHIIKVYPFESAQKFWGVALKSRHRSTNFTKMNRLETAFCLSLWLMIIIIIEKKNHEYWQWVWPLSMRPIVQQTSYVFVMSTVYSDGISLPV